MKIDITFERADILRLVQKDMEARGLKVKAGTAIAYKGALEVKFSVETEDDAPLPAIKPTTEPGPKVEATPEPDAADMSAILTQSKRMKSQGGKFELKTGVERVLGPNESLEYPED